LQSTDIFLRLREEMLLAELDYRDDSGFSQTRLSRSISECMWYQDDDAEQFFMSTYFITFSEIVINVDEMKM
jgi:hypothetical protein